MSLIKETKKYYVVADLDDVCEPCSIFEDIEEATDFIKEEQQFDDDIQYTILECKPIIKATLKITLEDIKE